MLCSLQTLYRVFNVCLSCDTYYLHSVVVTNFSSAVVFCHINKSHNPAILPRVLRIKDFLWHSSLSDVSTAMKTLSEALVFIGLLLLSLMSGKDQDVGLALLESFVRH